MTKIRNAHYFATLLLTSIVISCTRDAKTLITIPPVINSTATILYERSFMNTPPGSVNGTAEFVKQDSIINLKLKNFATCNAPDRHIYSSNDTPPAKFIDLGSLRSTSRGPDICESQ